MREFNLLATTMRRFENPASSEMRYLLREIGDPEPEVSRTGVAGLIAAKAAFDPFEVVRKLRTILLERPYEFRYTLRVIPIEKVVRTELSEVQDAVAGLGFKIGQDETFRITVEKRFTALHSKDIIEAVAVDIKNKVDLTKPDRIILIEVVGGLTGVSIIKQNDVLCVQKEKAL